MQDDAPEQAHPTTVGDDVLNRSSAVRRHLKESGEAFSLQMKG
jgi:hypothetical protein